MILSHTSKLAIQALIYMATQPPGVAILNRTIAEKLGAYSSRGNQGGFCLRENGNKINLLQIILVIEGPGIEDACVLGFKVCSDTKPCLMHERWAPIRHEIVKLLKSQNLESLASEVLTGKRLISDFPVFSLDKKNNM